MNRNLLIVNFRGIGNGIIMVPFLKMLGNPKNKFTYHLTGNNFFQNGKPLINVDLPGLVDVLPAPWRRFERRDWNSIEQFLQDRAVNIVVNLRNEGPAFDRLYYEFKRKTKGIEFWDLPPGPEPIRIGKAVLNMFIEHGIDTKDFNPRWLENMRVNCSSYGHQVIFYIGASGRNKMWSTQKWAEVILHVYSSTNSKILIMCGAATHEVFFLDEIMKILMSCGNIQEGCVDTQAGASVQSVLTTLSRTGLLVSSDSYPVHMAAALGLPAIGIYLTTDSLVWGSECPHFHAMQARINCPHFKFHAGNCAHYDETCLDRCLSVESPSPESVANRVVKILENIEASSADKVGVNNLE